MTLDELKAELENCPVGSRKLDAMVASYFGWEKVELPSPTPSYYWNSPRDWPTHTIEGLPHFTSSLDAVVKLAEWQSVSSALILSDLRMIDVGPGDALPQLAYRALNILINDYL